MSTQRASQALLSRLAKMVLAEFNQEDLYVSQAPPTFTLGKEHFEVLQQLEADRLSDPSSVARLVELSRMVDCVQVASDVSTTPDTAPGYLSDVFSRLVDNVKFKERLLDKEQLRRYQQSLALLFEEPPFIKRPAYQEFCLQRADTEKKDIILIEMQQNLQSMETPEAKSVLSGEISALEVLLQEQRESLDSLDRLHHFRAAESIIDDAEREVDEIPETVRSMLESLELFQMTDPISNATHVGCNFSPAHLSEDNWIPIKLTQADIARWQTDDASASASNLNDSEIESISLEVQTVVCDRPWLWPALFKNQNWQWRSPSPNVSNGSLPNTNDLIPAYVYGLVVARNLTIKGRISARQKFQQVDSNLRPNHPPMSDFLMRAITPAIPHPVASPAVVQPTTMVLNPRLNSRSNARLRTAVATGRVAPAISRRAIQPALSNVVTSRRVATGTRLKTTILTNPTIRRPANLTISKKLRSRVKLINRARLIVPARGQVTDAKGRGIYQATIKITRQRATAQRTKIIARRTLSGSDGHFTAQLSPGRYQVKVEKAGFMPVVGSITVPQRGRPPVIRLKPAVDARLIIHIKAESEGEQRPFTGSAKLSITGNNERRTIAVKNQSSVSVSLKPGTYQVTLASDSAEQILPTAKQTIVVRLHSPTESPANSLIFKLLSAPEIINPEVQLLGVICRKVPACPT